MDNPLTFLGVVIGLFFLLWLVGGGPTRAISFSGPYITPITDENETQSGYGPKLIVPTTTISVGGASASASEKPAAPQTQAPAVSSYAGELTISRSTVASSQNPNQQYVEILLSSHSSDAITLSNWKLQSKTNTATVLIRNGPVTVVTLAANQTALIVTTFPAVAPHDTITLLDGSGAAVASLTY